MVYFSPMHDSKISRWACAILDCGFSWVLSHSASSRVLIGCHSNFGIPAGSFSVNPTHDPIIMFPILFLVAEFA